MARQVRTDNHFKMGNPASPSQWVARTRWRDSSKVRKLRRCPSARTAATSPGTVRSRAWTSAADPLAVRSPADRQQQRWDSRPDESVAGGLRIPGQSPGVGGANPQPVNSGLGFSNPFAPDTTQQPTGSPSTNPFANQQSGTQPGAQGQQNPAALNPALQAINSQLSNPTGAAGGNPNTQTAPGIAGVASTYEGVGIKIYNKRSKYKEWEFVYDPSTSTPTGSTTPGQNPLGQPAQSSGTPSGASPFGQTPNPFAPSSGQSPNSSQTPSSSTPAPNPFAPSSSPFGTPGQ